MSWHRAGAGVVVVVLSGWLSAAQAEEPVLLKYKLAKGDAQYYHSVLEMKQAQSLMGMKIENTTKQDVVSSRVVDDIDSKGNVTFRVKAERRKQTFELGAAGKYEFDSQSKDRDTSSAIGAELTPILERLTGSEYKVIVSPRGEVTEVKGFSDLIADLVKDKPFAAMFGGGENKGAAMGEQESFVVLSEKPVSPGDKWEVPLDAELGKLGKIRGKTTYTYEGPDKVGDRKTARIGISVEMSMELNIDQGAAKVSGTISTTNSSGTAQFDPAAGRLVSIKRNVSLSGQLTVDAGGMTIPVDNQQEQTSTLELLDKLPE